ncbi:MAG: Ig-like domain-containing protein [Bdellovibrionota bacterium]
MLNKLTNLITILLVILVSSCGAPPQEDIESADQTTTPIEIVSSDYSGTVVTATAYVSISSCTSNSTYNSSAPSPVALSTVSLIVNDSCTFNFQRLVVSGTTYYGITSYMTLNSSTSAVLRFSSTQGGSTPAIYVNAKTTNVYPVGSSPSFTFTVMTDSQFASAVAAGAFSTVNTSSAGNMGVGTISVAPSSTLVNPGILQVGSTQTYTATSTNADGSTNATAVTWSSSNTGVATVDSTTGVVTGVAAGKTNIIATITDSLGTHSTSTALTVKTPYLYVTTSNSTNMYRCSLSSGAIVGGSCVPASAPGTVATTEVDVIQNNFYVADYTGGNLYYTPVNQDGSNPKAWSTALSKANLGGFVISGSYAFIATNTAVQSCPFNSSTGIISSTCTSQLTTVQVQYLAKTTILGVENLIILDRSTANKIYVCQISGSTLQSCINTAGGDPTGAVASQNVLYVTNYTSKSLVSCPLTQTVSGVTSRVTSLNCTSQATFGLNPNGITINGDLLYVGEWNTNGSSKYNLWRCVINTSNRLTVTIPCNLDYITLPYAPKGMAVY